MWLYFITTEQPALPGQTFVIFVRKVKRDSIFLAIGYTYAYIKCNGQTFVIFVRNAVYYLIYCNIVVLV